MQTLFLCAQYNAIHIAKVMTYFAPGFIRFPRFKRDGTSSIPFSMRTARPSSTLVGMAMHHNVIYTYINFRSTTIAPSLYTCIPKHIGRYLIDKSQIMRNKHDRTGKIHKSLGQCIESVQVQMAVGLVE